MFEIAQPAVALHGTNSNKAAESPGSDWANFIIYELPIINVRNSAASCRTAGAVIWNISRQIVKVKAFVLTHERPSSFRQCSQTSWRRGATRQFRVISWMVELCNITGYSCIGLASTSYIRSIYVFLAGESPNIRLYRCIYTVLDNPISVQSSMWSNVWYIAKNSWSFYIAPHWLAKGKGCKHMAKSETGSEWVGLARTIHLCVYTVYIRYF